MPFGRSHTRHRSIVEPPFDEATLQRDDESAPLRPFLARRPLDIAHACAILKPLRPDAILTGARLHATRLVPTDKCPDCDIREDHDHLFRHVRAFLNLGRFETAHMLSRLSTSSSMKRGCNESHYAEYFALLLSFFTRLTSPQHHC